MFALRATNREGERRAKVKPVAHPPSLQQAFIVFCAFRSESNMLQLRDLSKNFGPFAALSSVNFSVGAGEVVGLLGENGAGKARYSTLLAATCNRLQVELRWNDKAIHFASPRDATPVRHRCGASAFHAGA
jgi:ABC-type transporter Mla maintaining outer membrane lipid asymmetry ATPase subunit MlaF